MLYFFFRKRKKQILSVIGGHIWCENLKGNNKNFYNLIFSQLFVTQRGENLQARANITETKK